MESVDEIFLRAIYEILEYWNVVKLYNSEVILRQAQDERIGGIVRKIVFILVIFSVFASFVVFASTTDIQPVYGGHEKISLSMKSVWRRAMRVGDLLVETDCTVKLKKPVNKKVLKELKDAGLKVQTVLKTVVTGKIHIGDLPILVAVEDVKSVDGGKRLFYK